MNKKVVAIILIVVIIMAIVIGVRFLKKGDSNNISNVKYETAEDIKGLIDQIYEKTSNEMFGLETREIDINDEMALKSYTGLDTNDGIEKIVVSESMITATAYSLAIVKVDSNANIENIKQTMVDNIDMRRWICVGADVLYATNYGDVIFLIMASEENAKPQYEAFKEIVKGKVGKELTREAEALDF